MSEQDLFKRIMEFKKDLTENHLQGWIVLQISEQGLVDCEGASWQLTRYDKVLAVLPAVAIHF
jgi:hypothetical protein